MCTTVLGVLRRQEARNLRFPEREKRVVSLHDHLESTEANTKNVARPQTHMHCWAEVSWGVRGRMQLCRALTVQEA